MHPMTRFTHCGCRPDRVRCRTKSPHSGHRGVMILALGLLGLPAAALAAPDGPCTRRGDRVELLLTADEFRIPAYDARRGLVLVQPQTELLPGVERQFAVKLRLPQPQVLMPLGPTGLFIGLDSGPDALEMVVVAEPGGPDCAVEARPACDELDVRSLHLKRGDMIISSRRLDQPLEPSLRLSTRVMERVQVEQGELDGRALHRIGTRGRSLGEACLRKALTRTRAIQGALTIELATSVLGERDRLRVVVDGLVNDEISRCLLGGLDAQGPLWADLGPATRLFLVLYFRGESTVEPAPSAPPMPASDAAVAAPSDESSTDTSAGAL